MLKTLYNDLEDFPQNEELEAEKAEIQSSITIIKTRSEYERVKQDLREYEKACMIYKRNLKRKKLEKEYEDLGRLKQF